MKTLIFCAAGSFAGIFLIGGFGSYYMPDAGGFTIWSCYIGAMTLGALVGGAICRD